jgi:hypothetical protein
MIARTKLYCRLTVYSLCIHVLLSSGIQKSPVPQRYPASLLPDIQGKMINLACNIARLPQWSHGHNWLRWWLVVTNHVPCKTSTSFRTSLFMHVTIGIFFGHHKEMANQHLLPQHQFPCKTHRKSQRHARFEESPKQRDKPCTVQWLEI